MLEKINALSSEAIKAIESATSIEALYEVKVKFLGKSGSFSAILKEMGKLTPDERRTIGKRANEVRDQLEQLYANHEQSLKLGDMNQKLEVERIDVTLPGLTRKPGALHPIAKVTQEICDIFAKLGFSARLGPHVEKDFYNFDALNIPVDHASRDLQDTFYVED